MLTLVERQRAKTVGHGVQSTILHLEGIPSSSDNENKVPTSFTRKNRTTGFVFNVTSGVSLGEAQEGIMNPVSGRSTQGEHKGNTMDARNLPIGSIEQA